MLIVLNGTVSTIIIPDVYMVAMLPPKQPPCAVTTDEAERDEALGRVLALIRSPGQRLQFSFRRQR